MGHHSGAVKTLLAVLLAVLPMHHSLVVTSPCCSEYLHRVSAFGPALPANGLSSSRTVIPEISKSIVVAATNLCAPTAENLNDTIVVVPRGGCSFGDKVLNSQIAGASAVVVYETDLSEDGLVTMSADAVLAAAIDVPSVFVSSATGVTLLSLLSDENASGVAVLNATGSVSYYRIL